MADRDIYDSNPDEIKQFEDRVSGFGTRDPTGVPLGDVFGHSLNRLTICYGILEAADLAADFAQIGNGDGIPPNFDFFPVGAVPQDRQGSKEFPAAHLAPCTLQVGDPKSTNTRPELYNLYSDGISRSLVTNLFHQTELVHVLTNYADGICEGTRRQNRDGMSHVLAQSCKMIIQDPRLSARAVFFDKLLPEFQSVATRQLVNFQQSLSNRFPDALSPQNPIVDQHGRSYQWDPDRTDTRIHSLSPQAWKANGQAVVQILSTYATTRTPRLSDLITMTERFQALKANEQREAVNRIRKR